LVRGNVTSAPPFKLPTARPLFAPLLALLGRLLPAQQEPLLLAFTPPPPPCQESHPSPLLLLLHICRKSGRVTLALNLPSILLTPVLPRIQLLGMPGHLARRTAVPPLARRTDVNSIRSAQLRRSPATLLHCHIPLRRDHTLWHSSPPPLCLYKPPAAPVSDVPAPCPLSTSSASAASPPITSLTTVGTLCGVVSASATATAGHRARWPARPRSRRGSPAGRRAPTVTTPTRHRSRVHHHLSVHDHLGVRRSGGQSGGRRSSTVAPQAWAPHLLRHHQASSTAPLVIPGSNVVLPPLGLPMPSVLWPPGSFTPTAPVLGVQQPPTLMLLHPLAITSPPEMSMPRSTCPAWTWSPVAASPTPSSSLHALIQGSSSATPWSSVAATPLSAWLPPPTGP